MENTVEGFNVLDGIQSLVSGITGDDCFPYSQIHLQWESNKVRGIFQILCRIFCMLESLKIVLFLQYIKNR